MENPSAATVAALWAPQQRQVVATEDSQDMEEGLTTTTSSNAHSSGSGDDMETRTELTGRPEEDTDEANWKLTLTRRQERKRRRAILAGAANGRETGSNGPAAPRGNAVETGRPEDKSTGAAGETAKTTATTRGPAQRVLRRKLPPLPKEDIKIIMRPKKGLAIKTLSTHQVARAIVEACGRSQQCRDEDFIVRLRNGSNIIIVSTPHEHTAALLRQVKQLKISGCGYDMNTYVAAPEDLLRGVIHGIDPGTTSDELLSHLRVRTQGVTIAHARMLGTSKTAVITFDGPLVPRYVLYYGGEVACHPYRPTRQVCRVCMQQGHRSDVCPTPDVQVCAQCGTIDPQEKHTCAPKCGLCGEDHVTGARECPNRLKTLRRRPARRDQGKTNPTGGRNSSTQRDQHQPQRRRWFSSDRDTSGSRSRSRSQSFPVLPPAGGIRQGQPHQQPKRSQGNKGRKQKSSQGGDSSGRVSWPAEVDPTIAPHTNDKYKLQPTNDKYKLQEENQTLKRELELLRIKQGQQEREMAELRALVCDLKRTKDETTTPQATPPGAENNEYVTMSTLQQTLQQMMQQISQQINEVKSSIRKQMTASNVRDKVERIYHRPGLAALSNDSNTPETSRSFSPY